MIKDTVERSCLLVDESLYPQPHPHLNTKCIINSQEEVGSWPVLAANSRPLVLPALPNSVTASGYTNLEVWLHEYSFLVENGSRSTAPTPGMDDVDGDGILDSEDNCPYVYNPLQKDSGGIPEIVASALDLYSSSDLYVFLPNGDPDGIGDACQCGDVAGAYDGATGRQIPDGRLSWADLPILAKTYSGQANYEAVAGPTDPEWDGIAGRRNVSLDTDESTIIDGTVYYNQISPGTEIFPRVDASDGLTLQAALFGVDPDYVPFMFVDVRPYGHVAGTPFVKQACEVANPQALADPDNDFYRGLNGNCPTTWNPQQEDADGDGAGDACDP